MSVLRNWQTTVAALGIILVEIGKALQGDFDSFSIEAIIVAIGLIFARDSNKSSEDSGIKGG